MGGSHTKRKRRRRRPRDNFARIRRSNSLTDEDMDDRFISSPSQVAAFLDDVLAADELALSTPENAKLANIRPYFMCLCCRCKFELGLDFIDHIHTCHHSFILDSNRDRFVFFVDVEVFSRVVKTVWVDFRFIRNEINHSEKSVIVVFMEMKMKQRFLARNSHDLLVGNEETALCLEQLNKDDVTSQNNHSNSVDRYTYLKIKVYCSTNRIDRFQNGKRSNGDYDENNNHRKTSENEEESEHDDEDDLDSRLSSSSFDDYDSTADDEFSSGSNALLFIDFSIIQFNRVISILRTLYQRPNATPIDIENSNDYKVPITISYFKQSAL